MSARAAAPVALAAAVALAYLVVAPASTDLAAQVFRTGLVEDAGRFVLWNGQWYGGHPTPGYSLLFPPLGALLGVRLTGALAVVAAAALFAPLVRGAFGDTPAVRAAALWFAGGVALQLLTGRLAFLLGVALGLAAALAAQRGRRAPALVLAALTTAASPVAGAFLVLAAAAWAVGARRPLAVALAAAAALPGLVIAALFPESGTEPFVASALVPAVAALAALALLLPPEQRVLRAAAVLSLLAVLVAGLVPNPVGGNATRLAALAAGPVLLAVPLRGRRRTLALAALPLLAYWQLVAPVRDAVVAWDDPATEAAFFAPLVAELEARGGPPGRVEVPFTRTHWEAAHLARHVPLARGWFRQLDRERNPLFYGPAARLTPGALRAWLLERGVRWVAVPDAPLDDAGRREAALVRAGAVPGLRPVWANPDWHLFAVEGALPLASGAGRLTRHGVDAFTVAAARPGAVRVRVRWSPHWAVTRGAGCVARGPGDTVVLRARAAGTLRVTQRISVIRGIARSQGPRCHG